MLRNNLLNIKAAIFIPVITSSMYFLYLSYVNYQNIILDQAIVIKSDDYNYFDPINFRKYYDKIIIENLETSNLVIDAETLLKEKTINKKNILVSDKTKTINEYETKIIKIVPGDNFASVLKRSGIKPRDTDKIIINGKKIYDFSKIYAGDKVTISHNYNNDELDYLAISYQFTEEKILNINLKENIFNYNIDLVELTSEEVFVKGIIVTSLYKAMKDKGLSEIIIEEMIKIFSFDVDFQRDIYKNDEFEILFTRFINKDGRTVKIDDPKYLKLYSRGDPLTYFLFNNSEFSEYFDEEGKGMTKSLMKTPINGAKISSGYGMRKHPITGYNKTHKGVDFAAPSGTPIFAAGNGVIEYIGRNGGYGKYIRIRHDGTYKTAYAHLKNFKKSLNNGDRVKQGDVIGYVGSTGNSTGPHLHYEILVKNTQINPATLKLPSGRNLKEQEMKSFKLVKNKVRNKLLFMRVD